MALLVAGAVAQAAVGCSDDDGPWEKLRFENQGDVCLRSTESGALEATVTIRCFSGSCSRARVASCSVEVTADQITIASEGTAEERGGSCTDDCQMLRATCVSDPLDPGEYAVAHGSVTGSIELPAEAAALGEEPSFGCF